VSALSLIKTTTKEEKKELSYSVSEELRARVRSRHLAATSLINNQDRSKNFGTNNSPVISEIRS
jgi:hypothetical protein